MSHKLSGVHVLTLMLRSCDFSAHYFRYKKGWYAVSERFQRVEGSIVREPSTAKIAVHHYGPGTYVPHFRHTFCEMSILHLIRHRCFCYWPSADLASVFIRAGV